MADFRGATALDQVSQVGSQACRRQNQCLKHFKLRDKRGPQLVGSFGRGSQLKPMYSADYGNPTKAE
jgi:hypothetical protein